MYGIVNYYQREHKLMKVDINDVEQQMFRCWNVVEDLDALFEGVMESDMSKDDISNALLGLKVMRELDFEKFHRMMDDVYEERRGFINALNDANEEIRRLNDKIHEASSLITKRVDPDLVEASEDDDDDDDDELYNHPQYRENEYPKT